MDPILLEHIQKIIKALIAAGYEVGEPSVINYGCQFKVGLNNESGVIRIYNSKKKGINPDLSQILKLNWYQEVEQVISKLGYLVATPTPISEAKYQAKSAPIDVLSLPYPIIGTDESGKGDFFGPLVVSAVYITEQQANWLSLMGVKDSKKFKDAAILDLASILESKLINQYVVIEISPKRYNELQQKFKNQQKTLNSLLGWGHAKALEELLGKVNCSTAIIDKFGDERFVNEMLKERGKELTIIQRHKAEEHLAVAAASILARARFLRKLAKASNDIKINLPKGASDNVKKVGKEILNKCGLDVLSTVAKTHFKMGL